MSRNDQVTRQWLLLQQLEGPRGATLTELAAALPEDYPRHLRTIRWDLEALEVRFPLVTERVHGRTRWRLVEGLQLTDLPGAFSAWNELWVGASLAHDRFLKLVAKR